jgi:acetyl-CoA C-acetyltransferase
MSDALADPLDRLLADLLPPEAQRSYLAGASIQTLREQLGQLGYDDALVAESNGGAGLALSDLREVLVVLGRRLCPLPIGETIVARAMLSQAGIEAPVGTILLLTPAVDGEGQLTAHATPLALAATHALLDIGSRHLLVDLDTALVEPCAPGLSLSADLSWQGAHAAIATIDRPTGPLRPTAAAIRSTYLAGVTAGILDLTADYAGTRRQFGKPIADFQAIQQLLAVLAEEVAAASMAAAIGSNVQGPFVPPLLAAIAKMRTSIAAERVAAISHAIHGAIGISEEYDLQLFTRRLAEERLADGGESFWAERIGRHRMESLEPSSVTFVRESLAG